MEGIRHEDLRDLLRRVGASSELVNAVRRVSMDGRKLRETTEDEARRELHIDVHAAKQLMRVRKRLGGEPEWVDSYGEGDVAAAEGLAGFYRDVGAGDKAGHARKILASYSDDPKLLLQLVMNKYPGREASLSFLREWADVKQASINTAAKLARSLRYLIEPIDLTLSPPHLIASYSDAPWLLTDFLTHTYSIPSADLSFLSKWGSAVTAEECKTIAAVKPPRPSLPPPPQGPAPDWAIKYSQGADHSSEVHRLRSILASCTVEMKRQKIQFRELHLKHIQQEAQITRISKDRSVCNAVIHELEQRVIELEAALAERDKMLLKMATNSEVHELRQKLSAAHDAINHSLGLTGFSGNRRV